MNIKFEEVKKIGKHYCSQALTNGKEINFTVNNLMVKRTIYKEGDKIFIDFYFNKSDRMAKIFRSLVKQSLKYVSEKHNKDIESIKGLYVSNVKDVEEESIIKMEVKNPCSFIQKTDDNRTKNITFRDIEVDDVIDITIKFVGIIFGKSKFTNKFIIYKMIKQVEEEVEFEGCNIVISEEDEDEELDEDISEIVEEDIENIEKQESYLYSMFKNLYIDI